MQGNYFCKPALVEAVQEVVDVVAQSVSTVMLTHSPYLLHLFLNLQTGQWTS